ncbi:MAG: peptide chain release factor N(5)-glutamine methyltransferase [Candidatus Andersenbacteria bacterium]|nr:peptide chain release factor N(5)-glutamine methyltransferase [Candidatus Andersenbacteria bacterium]MBI3250507.1 peptide chain release factor N(5)-glutamine methyltransferase [Candidatus Andersenbacteria bacterium]
MTIQQTISRARTLLASASDAPDLDTERLLLHVLKKADAAWIYAHNDTELTEAQNDFFQELITQRASGKPLAYILGEAEFYGRPFYVDENVLVPRPETEGLIHETLKYVSKNAKGNNTFTIADIGTGSGCIAITLALELPAHFTIIAIDISPEALEVAKRNAVRHHVIDKIKFIQGNMLEPLKDQRVDLIVSNPPYIPTSELNVSLKSDALDTRGLVFEPRLALDGGIDGQTYVKQIKKSGVPFILETTGGLVSLLRREG